MNDFINIMGAFGILLRILFYGLVMLSGTFGMLALMNGQRILGWILVWITVIAMSSLVYAFQALRLRLRV